MPTQSGYSAACNAALGPQGVRRGSEPPSRPLRGKQGRCVGRCLREPRRGENSCWEVPDPGRVSPWAKWRKDGWRKGPDPRAEGRAGQRASPRQGSRPREAGLGRTPRWTPGPGQCPPRRALLAWLWDVSLRRPPPPPVPVLALHGEAGGPQAASDTCPTAAAPRSCRTPQGPPGQPGRKQRGATFPTGPTPSGGPLPWGPCPVSPSLVPPTFPGPVQLC